VRAISDISTPLPPATVCGYTVLRSPSPGSYIALADGGREVFLKPLDPDCLLHGQLHPSIKERLARVRELALKSAANLHGVERDGSRGENGAVFLIWEFVRGEPLESRARSLPASELLSLLREVVLSVEALHQVGIVHGGLHGRNIIIDPAGRPHLTHISPLLFHDPAVDVTAISAMSGALIGQREDIDQSVFVARAAPQSLRELASGLVAAETPRDQVATADLEDRSRRKRMLLLALAVAAAGVIVAATVAILSSRVRP
jgi:serine/threonine protein kinase